MNPFSSLMAPDAGGSERLFRKLMLQASLVGVVLHLAFASLFFLYDIAFMAAVNIVSVVVYLIVFVVIYRSLLEFSAWLMVALEILIHAALAVYLLGWDTGFHFYAMLIPPVTMISPLKEGLAKMPAVVLLTMVYVLMDYGLRTSTPVYLLPELVRDSLYYFNLVAVLFVMVFLTGLYYRLVVTNEQKLKQLATTDSLTGLHNRRSLQRLAERELDNHRRNGLPLAVMLCDLDNFKRINDLFGHQAGDQVLMHFSRLLKQQIRRGDLAARWGGEEFLLLLPAAPAQEAALVAERIRNELEAAAVSCGDKDIYVTATIGISELQPGDTLEHLVARADDALYQGKEAGRNRIVLPPSPLAEA